MRRSPLAAACPLQARESRKEPLAAPSVALAHKQPAVVQPRGALLPEFDASGNYAKAGPIGRSRHLVRAEAIGKILDPTLEFGTAFERTRLIRGPGADLAVARPRGEIGVRLVGCHRLDRPFDPYLSAQRFPQKAQRGLRVAEQLCRFAAFEIGVEDKTAPVE